MRPAPPCRFGAGQDGQSLHAAAAAAAGPPGSGDGRSVVRGKGPSAPLRRNAPAPEPRSKRLHKLAGMPDTCTLILRWLWHYGAWRGCNAAGGVGNGLLRFVIEAVSAGRGWAGALETDPERIATAGARQPADAAAIRMNLNDCGF